MENGRDVDPVVHCAKLVRSFGERPPVVITRMNTHSKKHPAQRDASELKRRFSGALIEIHLPAFAHVR